MELEEDLNLKLLDEVKKEYLNTFEYFKNGKPNWSNIDNQMNQDQCLLQNNIQQQNDQRNIKQYQQNQVQNMMQFSRNNIENNESNEQDNNNALDRITFLYKFIKIENIPIKINHQKNSTRKVFHGEYIYAKNKIIFNIIAKNIDIQNKMLQMFKKPQQCYILHKVLIFQMNDQFQNQQNYEEVFKNSNYIYDQDFFENNNEESYYYVLDEDSQILEDESMDYISTLTRLSENQRIDEFEFQTNYNNQMTSIQPPLNLTHFKLLQPRVISSFEGIITQVIQGKNLLEIEELIDQFHLNSRRDRFYQLKVVSAVNFLDTLDVYLIYDNEDQEAKQELQFYLQQYQRILIFQSLRHFNHKLNIFAISFYYCQSQKMYNKSNFDKFNIQSKGIEFFSRYDRNNNKLQIQKFQQNCMNLKLQNLSILLQNGEGCLIRQHMKIFVKVKKIKYFKIKLICIRCKNEWTKGFNHCINCKEINQYISFSFQVLVQDQQFMEQQGYIYLYDELAIEFFNITEQERRDILQYLQKNDTFMQLYYSVQQDYPLSIIRFKDRIFTKDVSKYIVGLPFADIQNKILNQNQLMLNQNRYNNNNNGLFQNIFDNNGDDNKYDYFYQKNINKQQIFINGTYIASNFISGQKIAFKQIPCLKVIHVFQQDTIISQATKLLEEINQLKIQISSIQ